MAEKKWNRPPNCEECKHCKKECTIHWTQIINDEVYKLDMCETCPVAKQLKEPLEFGLLEQLIGQTLKAIEGSSGASTSTSKGGLKCAACGYTETEFKKTGRFGCPECYKVFLAPKMDLLSKMHKGITHKGKEPKKLSGASLKQKVVDLKAKLTNVIKAENYEEAARLRDEINALERESQKQGSSSKSEKPKNTKSK